MSREPQDYDRVELVWPGKRTEVERVRLPFQVIERVNDVRGARGAQGGLLTSESQLPDWWPEGWRNRLIWGDNKYVLASLLDEFAGKVDLIYIDPPFAVGQDFSFRAAVGDAEVEKRPSAIEELAYRDTWGKGKSSYLQMLYERLVLAKELLSTRGSIYVHVGYQIAHDVKLVLDDVFTPERFGSEVVWKRTGARNDASLYNVIHDVVFLYTSGDQPIWNQAFEPYSDEYIKSHYRHIDPGGRRWQDTSLIPPGNRGPVYEWNGITRPWRLTRDNMERLEREGRLYYTSSGTPRYKRYLDEMPGTPIQSVWTDVSAINSQAREDTGFDTQKPEALLERIVKSSSNEGSLVTDFFCGSGTTSAVAEKLGRRWIAADIGRFAIQTTRKRLLDIPGCRPFEVLNLGRYERRYWQGMNATPAVAIEVPDLSTLNVLKLPVHRLQLGGLSEGTIQYRGRDMLTSEIVDIDEFERDFPADAVGYLNVLVRLILRECRLANLANGFASLAPLVKQYVEDVMFAGEATMDEARVMIRLNDGDAKARIFDVFVGAIRGLSVVERDVRPTSEWIRVSDTNPFPTTRPTVEAKKTVFNLVPCDRGLEERFARWLDTVASDVLAFAKNESAMHFEVAYLSHLGGLRYYRPDFIVRTHDVTYIVETKGLEDLEVPHKDQRITQWCVDATTETRQAWRYLKVDGKRFDAEPWPSLTSLAAAASP